AVQLVAAGEQHLDRVARRLVAPTCDRRELDRRAFARDPDDRSRGERGAVEHDRVHRPRTLRAGKNRAGAVANTVMAALAMPKVVVDESQDWPRDLRDPATREAACARLHALLLRAARFEIARRDVPHGERDDLALQAADDALIAILAKLDTFRGASRFTTWAYKFVLLEAGVKARRRAWHGREVELDEAVWPVATADDPFESTEVLEALSDAVQTVLTPHQRQVFVALA